MPEKVQCERVTVATDGRPPNLQQVVGRPFLRAMLVVGIGPWVWGLCFGRHPHADQAHVVSLSTQIKWKSDLMGSWRRLPFDRDQSASLLVGEPVEHVFPFGVDVSLQGVMVLLHLVQTG